MSYQIEVKSNGEQETIECEKGDKLLKVLLKNGYDINAYCGGEGICGKCKVKLKGDIKEPSKVEQKYLDQKELNKGYRLSCQYEVESDLQVIYEAKEDITVM